MTRTVTGIPVDQAIATISAVGGVLASTIALILAAVLSMSIALFILERAVPGPRPVMRKGCFSGIKDSGVLIMLLLANVQVRIPSGMLSRPVATLCSISSSFLTIVVTAVATVALQSAASSVAITGFSDLSGKTLVMPAATTAAAYVDRNGVGITVTTTQTLDEALERFAAGEGDAMLYDQPILTAFIGTDAAETGRKRFSVIGQVVERQQYGIALNPAFGEDLRKAFDRAILAVYGTNEVAEMRARWLYTDEAATATSAIDSATSSPSSITEFLRDNFVSIAVLVSAVVGVSLLVGLLAFAIRTALRARRKGDCTRAALAEWVAASCTGERRKQAVNKRRRVAGHGSMDAPSEAGGSSVAPSRAGMRPSDAASMSRVGSSRARQHLTSASDGAQSAPRPQTTRSCSCGSRRLCRWLCCLPATSNTILPSLTAAVPPMPSPPPAVGPKWASSDHQRSIKGRSSRRGLVPSSTAPGVAVGRATGKAGTNGSTPATLWAIRGATSAIDEASAAAGRAEPPGQMAGARAALLSAEPLMAWPDGPTASPPGARVRSRVRTGSPNLEGHSGHDLTAGPSTPAESDRVDDGGFMTSGRALVRRPSFRRVGSDRHRGPSSKPARQSPSVTSGRAGRAPKQPADSRAAASPLAGRTCARIESFPAADTGTAEQVSVSIPASAVLSSQSHVASASDSFPAPTPQARELDRWRRWRRPPRARPRLPSGLPPETWRAQRR